MSDAENIQSLIDQEESQFLTNEIWMAFDRSWNDLNNAFSDLPFDWRFNAAHWAFDVRRLLKEIVFSFCRMRAYANDYKDRVPIGAFPSSSDPHVSYFSGNALTSIDSCRDKLALMVWAYFDWFNPEVKREVLDWKGVLQRLTGSSATGVDVAHAGEFTKSLSRLNTPAFQRAECYRNLRIHRREPRVEIHGVREHHDWPYLIPLKDPVQLKKHERELRKKHPEQDFLWKAPRIDGMPCESRRLKDRVWDYSEIETIARESLLALAVESAVCFDELRKRPPFRKP